MYEYTVVLNTIVIDVNIGNRIILIYENLD